MLLSLLQHLELVLNLWGDVRLVHRCMLGRCRGAVRVRARSSGSRGRFGRGLHIRVYLRLHPRRGGYRRRALVRDKLNRLLSGMRGLRGIVARVYRGDESWLQGTVWFLGGLVQMLW